MTFGSRENKCATCSVTFSIVALKPGPGGEVALVHLDLLGQKSLGKGSKHISTKLVVKDGDLPLVESVKKSP